MGPRAAELRANRIAAWAKHQFATEALRRVLEVMDRRGIDVLPVKGVVLAHSLYESIEDRPMVDVDLRVRPRDLRRVAHAARAQGWEVRSTSRQLGTLEFSVARTLVEFETTIGSPGVCAIGVDEMLARSVWRSGSLGVRHREPEIHDHALILCVNAFKDKLVLAKPWVREDLLRISRTPGFAPTRLAERAAEAGLRTLVLIVSEWLADHPDGVAWRRVADAIGDSPRPRYAALYRALVARTPKGLTAAVVARAASDTGRSRISAVLLGLVGTLVRGRGVV